jgi:hypothetical protein
MEPSPLSVNEAVGAAEAGDESAMVAVAVTSAVAASIRAVRPKNDIWDPPRNLPNYLFSHHEIYIC